MEYLKVGLLFRHSPGEMDENSDNSIRKAGNPTKVPTGYSQNTNIGHYRYTELFEICGLARLTGQRF